MIPKTLYRSKIQEMFPQLSSDGVEDTLNQVDDSIHTYEVLRVMTVGEVLKQIKIEHRVAFGKLPPTVGTQDLYLQKVMGMFQGIPQDDAAPIARHVGEMAQKYGAERAEMIGAISRSVLEDSLRDKSCIWGEEST